MSLRRLCRDLNFMLGFVPGLYWQVTWGFCAPVILSGIFIYSLIDFKPLTYEDYDYPDWADILGWCLSGLSIIQIPLWAIIIIIRQDAPTLKEKILKSCRSRESWGPTDPEMKREWLNKSSAEAPEEQSNPATNDKGECKLKKEAVAKLNQNEGNNKNHVNGLLSKASEDNPESYPGHYFSV